ncbi:MAG: peptidase [Faecalicatena sp.]|uniref:peptidase n=1 Tax=Faecalicatena sp. TaxID=2005360 RepID=UPI00258CF5B9|nr:peptidase [Faecalicatena sp.]MCI6465354.1 peptidase [Faecalicatena sp.]MDY4669447.1 peptidase [Oliverpabstia sp.]MDY5617484.1 peptidase [Lachnospiraceae bacterium]
MLMQETRDYLTKIGMPNGDAYTLPSSPLRFEDGGQYRFEVPGIQGPGAMSALLKEADNYGIRIHRITQTKGIMTLTDDEIDAMVGMAKDRNAQLILAIGPRATTDTSASVNTPEGVRMGYRLRGQEQIIRAVEDVKRAAKRGCRGFMVYDEGCLWLLDRMRKDGVLPADCEFKISAHTGHGNPCSARLMQELGANSFNPVRDIQLQMLSAIRQAISIPIDIHTENPKSTGGFIRHYEVPEMIRIAAPIYLKTGGSVAQTHSWDTTADDAKKRAKQVVLVKRMIEQYYPEAVISK